MSDNNIQSKIDYSGGKFDVTAGPIHKDIELTLHEPAHLAYRQDFNEDGSITHWYFLELSEKQYRQLQGLRAKHE